MFLEFYTIIITGIYQLIYQVLLCDMSYTVITEIPNSMKISLVYQTVCQNYICINNSFTILYFLPLCRVFYEIIPAFPPVLEFYWILFLNAILFSPTFVPLVVPLIYLNLNFLFWCGSEVTRIPEAMIWKTTARLAAREVEITTVGTPKWACCYGTCS